MIDTCPLRLLQLDAKIQDKLKKKKKTKGKPMQYDDQESVRKYYEQTGIIVLC